MLSNGKAVAIVAVSDMERAGMFYGDTLGLGEGTPEPGGGLLYACGEGSQLLVYPTSAAATNQATSASWQVDDVDAEIAALKAKGVTFEQYDLPYGTREGDIHKLGDLSAAWFKDPDGNILNIVSRFDD